MTRWVPGHHPLAVPGPQRVLLVESWGLPGPALQAVPHHKVMQPGLPGWGARKLSLRWAGGPGPLSRQGVGWVPREAGLRRAFLSSPRLSCLEVPRQSSISGPRFSCLGSGHLDWTSPWVSPCSDFSPGRQCSPELGVWSPKLADWVHTEPCPFLPAWSWAGEPRGWVACPGPHRIGT